MKDTAKEYFKKFNNKDIDGLKDLFDPDVELLDWEIHAKGMNNVLDANTKIFQSCDEINVKVIHMADKNNIVFAQLLIEIKSNNLTTIINVVDILTFKNGKICKIQAFKR
jgi:ketosteroid isomerase-like protein